LVDSDTASVPWPFAKPAWSMSQAALVLTDPSGCSKRGAPAGSAEACCGERIGLVKNEPALQVVGVEHHALAAAQGEHGPADVGGRRPLAHLDAEGAGQLGVRDGGAEVAEGELEGHRQHDVAHRLGLEPAVAVREAAVGGRERADAAVVAVVRAHRGDRLGDLLAVGADVLDGGRAGRAGDAREGLDTDPALVDGASHDVVPGLARRDRHHGTAAQVGVDRDATRQDPDDGGVDALVGDDQVAATAHDEHRVATLVGDADGLDEVLLCRGVDDGSGRAPQTDRGQVGEVHERDASSAPPGGLVRE
jgi:hypothetical protein